MNRPPLETLILPAALRAAILREAAIATPEECCGLLAAAEAGGSGPEGAAALRIHRIAPSRNLADDRRRRFEIDPQLWLDLRNELAAAGGGLRIAGCYHSHPEGPAAPSPRDLAEAWEPDFVWLIAAPAIGGAAGLALSAWLFEDDGTAAGRRFRPLGLAVDAADHRGGAPDKA